MRCLPLAILFACWCAATVALSATPLHKRIFEDDKRIAPMFPPTTDALEHHLGDLNARLRALDVETTATPHRHAAELFGQETIAHSIRTEMLTYGKDLPLIRLSHTVFPLSKQYLAFPLRLPHGQGGPGTTMAIVSKDSMDGFKLIGFSHLPRTPPDDFADYLGTLTKARKSGVISLGQLVPKMKLISSRMPH